MNFKQAAIKAGIGLILFPIIGAFLVLLIKSGDVGQMLAIVTSNISLQIIFMMAAGVISGMVVQQAKAGLPELLFAGLVCALVAVIVFGTYTGTNNFQPSFAASAFLSVPVAVMGTAIVLVPRLLFHVVRR